MRWAHGFYRFDRKARILSTTSSTAALRRRSPFPSKGKEQKGKRNRLQILAARALPGSHRFDLVFCNSRHGLAVDLEGGGSVELHADPVALGHGAGLFVLDVLALEYGGEYDECAKGPNAVVNEGGHGVFAVKSVLRGVVYLLSME